MNYESFAQKLFVRKILAGNIWKSEVELINPCARFVKVTTSNLVEVVLQKLKERVHFMIRESTSSSQWVRFIFFFCRYREIRQFKWYFISLTTMSTSDSFPIRLKSLRLCAEFLHNYVVSALDIYDDFSV